jgi:hypothetical protein
MLKIIAMMLSLSLLLGTGEALAHAKLLSSSPADKAQLAQAPKSLELKFSETARLAMVKLSSGGKEIPLSVDKSAKADQSFSLTLPALSPGSYTVQWTAVASDDGHVTKGSFSFSISG